MYLVHLHLPADKNALPTATDYYAYSLLLYACYSLLTLYACIQSYALYAINLIAYNHTFSFSLCQVKAKNFFKKTENRKTNKNQNE